MKKRINIEVLYKMIKIKVLTIISILLNKFYTFTDMTCFGWNQWKNSTSKEK